MVVFKTTKTGIYFDPQIVSKLHRLGFLKTYLTYLRYAYHPYDPYDPYNPYDPYDRYDETIQEPF
jgi:hypothetical protein